MHKVQPHIPLVINFRLSFRRDGRFVFRNEKGEVKMVEEKKEKKEMKKKNWIVAATTKASRREGGREERRSFAFLFARRDAVLTSACAGRRRLKLPLLV